MLSKLFNTTDTIPDRWLEWMADCLMRQEKVSSIVSYMVSKGFDQKTIEALMIDMTTHPYIIAGTKMARQLRRRDWLLDVYQRLMEQSGEFDTIEVRNSIGREEFYKHYHCMNRPIILKKQIEDWDVLTRWTPGYFKEKYGERQVQMTRMTEDENGQKKRYYHECLMSEFVDAVNSLDEANDWYMTNANHPFNKDTIGDLFDEVDRHPELLDPYHEAPNGHVLFGPKGTITDLHYDLANALYCQVYGRKHFKIISPHYLPNVYPYQNFLSLLDLEHDIDFERFPMAKRLKIHEFVLEPGDVMFLPIGWWHWATALDTSISLSFSNFYGKEGYLQYWDILTRHPYIND